VFASITEMVQPVTSRTIIAKAISSDAITNPIPASFLRGGTSKGIFINRAVLPIDRSKWDRIFLGIMGSPDLEHGRQLNGMGGGISSLSKVIVVGPSDVDGIDVEYTFVQVGIRDSVIDYSGNCGNLSSMVGVFSVDEKICAIPSATSAGQDLGERTHATIRSFNTNTQKIIDTTFPISSTDHPISPILDLPETSISGVSGKASAIMLDFINPAGARTGRLLPTRSPFDTLEIPIPSSFHRGMGNTARIQASCIDASNPTVFISRPWLSFHFPEFISPLDMYLSGTLPSSHDVGEILESVRQAGARRMGLDPTAQAQPKIAVLSPPSHATNPESDSEDVDIVIHALSMGVVHKAVPMTVGLCLGVAARIEQTIPWTIVNEARNRREKNAGPRKEGVLRIRHPSGIVDVGAEFEGESESERGLPKVKSATIVRTGRRLMKGVVWW
jgi:2-methylaconitate cis-trans-isomerase PrpF